MVDVTVEDEIEAAKLLAALDKRLEDWRDFWGLAQAEIAKVQIGGWSRASMGSVKGATVDARQQRSGYYENEPAEGLVWAKYFWTGALAAATTYFTWTRPLAASIDPHRNYRGPLSGEFRDPFGAIVGHESDMKIWNTRGIDKALDATIETWLTKNVLPDG